jgi:hypothetical protein
MLLEDILLAAAVGAVILVFGVPIVRYLKVMPWRRRDPLAEAKERLRIAKLEAEAARLNREAEKIYENLYEETLAKDHSGTGARVGSDKDAAEVVDQRTEKRGKA